MRKYLLNFSPFILIVVTLIIFYPILFGEKIIENKDIIFLYLPGYKFLEDSIASSIWYSGILSGMPVFATQFGLFFHPLYKFFIGEFGFINSFNWLTYMNIVAGLGSMYWLGLIIFKRRILAIVASAIFIFSQFNLSQTYFTTVTPFFYVLPLTYVFIIKIRENKYIYIIWLLAAWLSALLLGHPQFILYTIIAGLVFALFTDMTGDLLVTSKIKKFRVTLIFLGTIILSIFFASPWIMRSKDLVHLTARESLTLSQIKPGAINTVAMIKTVFPQINLPVIKSTCCGGSVLYVGIISMILAIYTFFLKNKPKNIVFFQYLAIVSFVTSLNISPLIFLISKIPIFEFLLYPYRTLFIFVFSVSILSAYGLGRLQELFENDKYIIFKRAVGVILGGIVIFSLIISFSLSNFKPFFYQMALKMAMQRNLETPIDKVPILVEDVISKFQWQFSFDNYDFVISLFLVLLPIIVYYISIKYKLSIKQITILIAGIIVLSPIVIWKNFFEFIPVNYLIRIPNTVVAIKSNEANKLDLFRIFTFTKHQGEYEKAGLDLTDQELLYKLRFELIIPNSNIYHGLDSIDGYENFMTVRQSKLLSWLGSERSQTPLTTAKLPEKERVIAFQSRNSLSVLSMMNVKYIVSSFELDKSFKKVYGEKIGNDIPVFVYENTKKMPRIYFPKDAKIMKSSEEEVFREITQNSPLPGNILIECDNSCPSGKYNHVDKLSFTISSPGTYQGVVDVKDQNWLVLSESLFPGSIAYIDNIPTKIYPTNYVYQAILIPRGKHTFKFTYEPPSINLKMFVR